MRLKKCVSCNGTGKKSWADGKCCTCDGTGRMQTPSKRGEILVFGKVYTLNDSKKEVELALRNQRLYMLPRTSKGTQPFTYYTGDDIKLIMTKSEVKAFNAWMYGQTCQLIEDKGKKPVCGYYSHDVGRFFVVRYGGHVLWD